MTVQNLCCRAALWKRCVLSLIICRDCLIIVVQIDNHCTRFSGFFQCLIGCLIVRVLVKLLPVGFHIACTLSPCYHASKDVSVLSLIPHISCVIRWCRLCQKYTTFTVCRRLCKRCCLQCFCNVCILY